MVLGEVLIDKPHEFFANIGINLGVVGGIEPYNVSRAIPSTTCGFNKVKLYCKPTA